MILYRPTIMKRWSMLWMQLEYTMRESCIQKGGTH